MKLTSEEAAASLLRIREQIRTLLGAQYQAHTEPFRREIHQVMAVDGCEILAAGLKVAQQYATKGNAMAAMMATATTADLCDRSHQ